MSPSEWDQCCREGGPGEPPAPSACGRRGRGGRGGRGREAALPAVLSVGEVFFQTSVLSSWLMMVAFVYPCCFSIWSQLETQVLMSSSKIVDLGFLLSALSVFTLCTLGSAVGGRRAWSYYVFLGN